MITPTYSTLFSCLYDEPEPIGHLGRGTHYSVFRSVEWLDVVRAPLAVPQVHDFAVIWDEDHDIRVIDAVEEIYMAGLLSPIQFIGERKGHLHIIVAAKFYLTHDQGTLNAYLQQLNAISGNLNHRDYWPTEVGMFERSLDSPQHTALYGLIDADEHRVITYVRNIDSLWNLGTKPFTPRPCSDSNISPPPIPFMSVNR